MAVGTFTLYRANLDDLRLQDLVAATVKLALVTSAYTPDATNSGSGHSLWSSPSANEIAAGNGYTAGGATLAGLAASTATNGWKFVTNNTSWTASGGSIPAWRYAVMYVSGSLWGMTNPLIGYFLGDATPADSPATTTGNILVLGPNLTNGWFTITQA